MYKKIQFQSQEELSSGFSQDYILTSSGFKHLRVYRFD